MGQNLHIPPTMSRPTDSRLLLLALLEQCPDFFREALRQFIEEGQQDNKPEESVRTALLVSLLRNSGSLLAQAGLKFHYPSFTTRYPNDGETADESSPCPRLLLQLGFPVFNVFWMQAYYRLEKPNHKRCSPMKKWSPDVVLEHEAFSSWCENHSGSIYLLRRAESFAKSSTNQSRDF